MASRPERERQGMYLAYRDLFCGSKARVRNRKVVRSIVLKHWAQSGITPDEQHLDNTITILKELLKGRVFESERKARETFPELFAKSPSFSHNIAHSSGLDVMSKEVARTDPQEFRDNLTSLRPQVSCGVPPVTESQLARFPFDAQHRVLSRVQQLLEETCFRFMERWLPSTLALNNWTCAAAIELTKSLSIIKKNFYILPDSCMDTPEQTLFKKIAPEVAQLRHSAVHRLHLEHDKFLQQIDCARILARLLQHPENLNILETLYSQVDALVKKLEYETNIVKQKAGCILAQLSRQRETLVQREQQLRDTVAQRYSELAAAAGRGVLEPMQALLFTNDSKSMRQCDGTYETIEVGLFVNENDIESDEDRLQAELE